MGEICRTYYAHRENNTSKSLKVLKSQGKKVLYKRGAKISCE